MAGIDAARAFVAEGLRALRRGGVLFVVVPDYLKERAFFWDIDYTHNFVTTERRVRQLLYDGGLEIAATVRSIGAATGLRRDALAAGALLVNLPGVDAVSRWTRTEELLFPVCGRTCSRPSPSLPAGRRPDAPARRPTRSVSTGWWATRCRPLARSRSVGRSCSAGSPVVPPFVVHVKPVGVPHPDHGARHVAALVLIVEPGGASLASIPTWWPRPWN